MCVALCVVCGGDGVGVCAHTILCLILCLICRKCSMVVTLRLGYFVIIRSVVLVELLPGLLCCVIQKAVN